MRLTRSTISGTPANNLVGPTTDGRDGNYTINVSTFRGTGLPIGSIVDVNASATGYLPASAVRDL